jgi:hypothetical protein
MVFSWQIQENSSFMDAISLSNSSPVISCDTPPLSTATPPSDSSFTHQKIKGLVGHRVIGRSVPLAEGTTLRDQEIDRRKECLTMIVKALSYKPAPSRELLLPIPIPLSDEKRDCLAAVKGLIAGEEKALSLDLKEWFLEIAKMIAFAQLPFEAFIAQDPSKKNIFWLYEIYLATQTVSKKEVSTQFFDQYSLISRL